MTPLEIATQKGYSQVVAYLNERVELQTAGAQRIVNVINCNGPEGLGGLYETSMGIGANISVPVQNCNGLPTDITSLPYMTSLQLAKQKGYSRLVAQIIAQAALEPPSIQTAQLLVNIINCGVSEDVILGNIHRQTMGIGLYEDVVNTSVLVQNCDLPAM